MISGPKLDLKLDLSVKCCCLINEFLVISK